MSDIVRSSLKGLVKGSSLFLGSFVAGNLLWFATKVLIIRTVTPEELGLYSLAVSVSSLIAIIFSIGLPDGATRFVSIFLGEHRDRDAHVVAGTSMTLGLGLGLAASACLYFSAPLLARHIFYKPEATPMFQAISAFPFLLILTNIIIGTLRGHGDVKARAYFGNLGQPLAYLVLLAAYYFIQPGALYIYYAFSGAYAICAAGTLLYARKAGFWGKIRPHGFGHLGKLVKFSLPLLGVAVIGVLLTWSDTLMLARYMKSEDVAVYNVAVSLARLLSFTLSAASFVLLPVAGDMIAKGQKHELKRTYQVLTKWFFIATIPAFFVFFFFPEMCITFLFEQRYVAASTSLMILSAGYIVSVFTGVSGVILMAAGQSIALMRISLVSTLANILMNYMFIKHLGFGITGAASATAISFFINGALTVAVLHRKHHMHPFTANYLRPIIAASSIGVILYLMAKSLPLSLWVLPLYLLLFVTGYACSILLTRSIEQEDVDILRAILKRLGIQAEGVLQWLGSHVREP
jgi:O-antigen/teichoic acid export membrane protein